MLQRIAAGQFLQLTDQDGLQVTDFDVSSPKLIFLHHGSS